MAESLSDALLTIDEALKALRVSRSTLYSMMERGELPYGRKIRRRDVQAPIDGKKPGTSRRN